jgi:hypothetical protein
LAHVHRPFALREADDAHLKQISDKLAMLIPSQLGRIGRPRISRSALGPIAMGELKS